MRQDPETGSKRRPDRIDIIATAVLLIFTAALHLLYILITYMAFDRTNIAVGIDYEIPFIKEFAIPYVMWYAFLVIPFIHYWNKSYRDFIEIGIYNLTGLAICCIIFIIFPTSIDFRPPAPEESDIISSIVRFIYKSDPAYSVLPSLHCYESATVVIGMFQSRTYRDNKLVPVISLILASFICLSTLFIKQHSVIDVAAGIALAFVFIPVIGKIKKYMDRRYGIAENGKGI